MSALFPAAVLMSVVMTAAWLWQKLTRNAGWVDAFWTLGLGAAGVGVAVAAGSGSKSILTASAVGLWSLRLGLYIANRSRGGHEDVRYANFRREWGDRFETRLFVFLQVQALAATLLLVPIALAAASPRPFGIADIAAIVVLIVAVGGEAVADRQLHAFRSDPNNRGKVCDRGLWGLSRHPNYFFEWLHWFCYPLLAIGGDWGWVALIGPAFMYWLLAHVSGVPPLEAQMLKSRGEAYAAYQQRVRAFFPFPKGVRP